MGPFDRFNDRAKRVLALAQDEAIRFNHNYIGVEHLLLGLIREGEGIAARVLNGLGVDLSRARHSVELMIGRGDATQSPSEITLSPRTKKVIELAIDEARKFGHSHVGTEHLLLGVVREAGSVAGHILQGLDVPLEGVRMRVVAALAGAGQPPGDQPGAGRAYYDPRTRHFAAEAGRLDRLDDAAQRVPALAKNEAIGLGHGWLGTEHLLLGLISANGTKAQKALGDAGVALDAARAEVAKETQPGSEWQTPAIALTPRANQLIVSAAMLSGPAMITPEHLLRALIADTECAGMRVLASLGATAEKIREGLDRLAPPPAC